MIDILQAIIDFITYTPTFYVDGIPCEVDCAWIGAAIGLIGSLVGAGMSANASASSAKKMKKAAQKNYNMLMENAEMSKMSLYEQMESYEEDMDSYRSSMIQRYGLAGGIRANDTGLNEVSGYQFGVDDSIDIEKIKADYDEKWRQENADKDKWVKEQAAKEKQEIIDSKTGNSKFPQIQGKNDDNWTRQDSRRIASLESKYSKEYDKLYGAPSKQMTDEEWSNELGKMLKEYNGRQTNWQTKADNSAILNLQTSVSNMQKDINNAYKAGMIDYWQQRKNAQNVKDTFQFQAAGYSAQAQSTLASGFLSALQYGAQAYTQYKSGR